MPRLSLTALLSLALPPLFWAGNFIIARAARGDVPPFTLSFGRWLIALLVLLPFAWAPLKRDLPVLRAHLPQLILLALPGVAGFNSLVYLGLQSTAATNGMLLNSTIPALILLIGALAYRQPLSRAQSLGLLVSTLGVATVILHGDLTRLLTLDINHGDLIIFAAMVAWALYTLWLRAFPQVNRIGLLAAQILVALPLLAALSAWELHQGAPLQFTARSLGALAYVGLLPSVAAYILYMRAVALAGASIAGQFIHLLPLYGALLSALFLGETLAPYHAAGFALILAGLAIAARR